MRIAPGLEDVDELIGDFENAIKAMDGEPRAKKNGDVK
jgi:hypothetical protein